MKPLALLLAIAFAVAGCIDPTGTGHFGDGHHGGDGHHHDLGGQEGEGNLPITGAEHIVIQVTGGSPSEFRFTPERIEAQAGERVGVVFDNQGDAPHEFSIEAIEFHLHAKSGDTERGAFIAPAVGEYVIGCYIPGHFEAGMAGRLVVT